MKLGNGLYETYDYRTPGTATAYKLGTTMGGGDRTRLEYDFSGTANNGNVLAHRVWRSGTAWSGSQGYTYDALNRLSYASESGGWNRTYGYDRYGNRYVTTPKIGPAYAEPTEPTSSSHFNAANNRILTSIHMF
jgi:hypothetical protein